MVEENIKKKPLASRWVRCQKATSPKRVGLGVVQKARTRQIDASEIIGKAGSSEQEAPNHPQSSSKLIKYIYNIYQTYILYISIYIHVYVDFWDDHRTFQK